MKNEKSSRRRFLKTGALWATALAIPYPRCDTTPNPETGSQSPIEYGFNTHMHTKSDRKNDTLTLETFKKSVDLLQANKQKWIRFNIRQQDIINGTPNGTIDWNENGLQDYDEAIRYAKEHGLNIFLVTDVPNTSKVFELEKYKKTTRDYYAKLAERYSEKIAVWQIFNEPDVHNFLDYSNMNTLSDSYLSNFSAIVAEANTTIKQHDKHTKTTVNLSHWVRDPRPDADLITKGDQMLRSLGGSIDIVTLDLYPENDQMEIHRLPEYVAHFKKKFGKEVIIGELGLSKVGGFNEKDQITTLTQAINALKGGKVRPRIIIVYELTNEVTGNSTEDSYGVLPLPNDGKSPHLPPPLVSAMQ